MQFVSFHIQLIWYINWGSFEMKYHNQKPPENYPTDLCGFVNKNVIYVALLFPKSPTY